MQVRKKVTNADVINLCGINWAILVVLREIVVKLEQIVPVILDRVRGVVPLKFQVIEKRLNGLLHG